MRIFRWLCALLYFVKRTLYSIKRALHSIPQKSSCTYQLIWQNKGSSDENFSVAVRAKISWYVHELFWGMECRALLIEYKVLLTKYEALFAIKWSIAIAWCMYIYVYTGVGSERTKPLTTAWKFLICWQRCVLYGERAQFFIIYRALLKSKEPYK